ncbi:MAG: hypothetical protein ACXVHS_09370 [Methanobacterium sp.]
MFGNIVNVKSVPVDCKMNANGEYTVMNSVCNRVDCPSYGKWWCPFTGW